MKYIPAQSLREVLDWLRQRRGFVIEHYMTQKSLAINQYFEQCGLNAAAVGISGGVDSALVLALLQYAQKQPKSPLKHIIPLLIPIYSRGSSDQDIALARGKRLCEKLNIKPWICDLSTAQQSYVDAFPIKEGAWAEGQLLSIVRTPALYYAAALLQSQGKKSLVVGTTNRDEGAYLGFFGKASDAMVDLQPISDIHKSEVWALATHLGVPKEIVEAVPSGNVYDGRTDEEMIQAPYWFIELYLMSKAQGLAIQTSILSTKEQALYHQFSQAIERQHRTNAHKYRVGSPAVHLDVLPRGVPGGWICTHSL